MISRPSAGDNRRGASLYARPWSAPDQFQSTLELNVNFLRPVRPGRVIGKGRVVHRDGDMAFIEASLADAQGTLIATATATARVIALDRARSAA